MKLVAAAKVRRAQEAVVSGRPFSEALVDVLFNINEQLQTEDIDVPLTRVRPVKKVCMYVLNNDTPKVFEEMSQSKISTNCFIF